MPKSETESLYERLVLGGGKLVERYEVLGSSRWIEEDDDSFIWTATGATVANRTDSAMGAGEGGGEGIRLQPSSKLILGPSVESNEMGSLSSTCTSGIL